MGQLAGATGLTVRTLHHYDEIGLVVPSERTWSGHRRYTPEDVRRLYRVRALRSLGLSLEEIREILAGSPDDLGALHDLLSGQLDHLDAEIRRLKGVREHVRLLLEQIGSAAIPDTEQFLDTLEAMSMIESYYTQEQLDYLARRREELGEDTIKAVEAEWPPLIEKMKEHCAAGTPVDDPEVQALARRWAELVEMFHGGHEEVKEATKRMWQERSEELQAGTGCGPSPELMAYVTEAQRAAGIEM